MKLRIGCVVVGLLSLIVSLAAQTSGNGSAAVQVPPLIQFSSVATDLNGKPITRVVGITFYLYNEQQGGSPLWMETQNVVPDKTGHYTVTLGAAASAGLPTHMFASGEARWLGVQIEGQDEQPHVMLLAVPYALKAGDAQTVGGLPPSAFVLAPPAASGGSTSASSSSSSPSSSSSGAMPPVGGSGTTGYLAGWVDNNGDLGNSVVYQLGTGSTAKIGINLKSPLATLDIQGTELVRGLFEMATTGLATPSKGFNSNAFNLESSAYNSGTAKSTLEHFQWQAEPTGNNTTNPSATLNLLFGIDPASPAETGLKLSNKGIFTFASGQTFPGTGTITGVTAGTGLTGGGSSGNVTLSLIKTCSNGQVLQWNGSAWVCSSAGTGTITQVIAGTDLTGGGSSGSVTLNLDTTKVPQLNTPNSFTGNQTVAGNISATGSVSAATLGGNGSAVSNVNAALLNGTPSTSFALVTTSNTFPANQFFNGNGRQMIVGDPGCGAGFAALGFGALSGCNNYSLLGDGVNTYINRPTGGGVEFRENNIPQITITTGGTVSMTQSFAQFLVYPALSVTSNAEGNDGVHAVGGGGSTEFAIGGTGLLAIGGNEGNTETVGGDGVIAAAGNAFTGGIGMLAVGGNSSFGTTGGDGIDVYAGSGIGGLGYAGFFGGGDVNIQGNLGVSGQIFAGTKDFRVDHPLDPANKYFYHASVESSEMMNLYTGNVTLDGSGVATVGLPEWFEAVNTDFRYQLTAVGAAAPNLHIAQEVTNHQFGIAGGVPGMKVSWQVTGVRHDKFAQAHPLVVEEDKPVNQRGYYIEPSLYGQPEEKQMEWGRSPQKMRRLKELRARLNKPAGVK